MTPQEKKRLSYQRDRRNTYGENDKSSRKNIPRGKRLAVRSGRRFVSVALADVRGNVDAFGVVEGSSMGGVVDSGPVDKVEPRIGGRRPPRFRKWRDEPLGDVVACQLGRRGVADPAGAAGADARIGRDDLLPPVDELIRECLTRIPLSEREVRAARSVDAHRIRDAFRLIDAVGPLAGSIVDPVLAIELRTWRRLRHRR